MFDEYKDEKDAKHEDSNDLLNSIKDENEVSQNDIDESIDESSLKDFEEFQTKIHSFSNSPQDILYLYNSLIQNNNSDLELFQQKLITIEELGILPQIISSIPNFAPEIIAISIEIINLLISTSDDLMKLLTEMNGFLMICDISLANIENLQIVINCIEFIKLFIVSPSNDEIIYCTCENEVNPNCVYCKLINFLENMKNLLQSKIYESTSSLLVSCLNVYTERNYERILQLSIDFISISIQQETTDDFLAKTVSNITNGLKQFGDEDDENKFTIIKFIFESELRNILFQQEYSTLKIPIFNLISQLFQDLINRKFDEHTNSIYDLMNKCIGTIPLEFITTYFNEKSNPDFLPSIVHLMTIIVQVPVTTSTLDPALQNDIRFNNFIIDHLINHVMFLLDSGSLKTKELAIEFLDFLSNIPTSSILMHKFLSQQDETSGQLEFIDNIHMLYELGDPEIKRKVVTVLSRILQLTNKEEVIEKINNTFCEEEDEDDDY
ncbi:hypothetical protein TVAG_239070 [Trichomonas vaginalis G3]|uniref:Uncharacterized protein n=1 Tax=Trichomonas vaginalis (strain ATCC PRA-98 / G3) TaxID=412133 RepID=A2DGD8_TRIV3|nr:hypothetical protein TVAGG3_0966400 [Trichomonas vaginalis G3]EAY20534.1 hypothetical protein TVAG_239070 [Trichomonas vaginalis G3]KAI5488274.1 hypothetical protein TVAGG3_0966400 [Trichomonas vaginalis G3]|eukprot:XP_001581520.1 hypothetical protein [Trichomonas vaginalis G3]